MKLQPLQVPVLALTLAVGAAVTLAGLDPVNPAYAASRGGQRYSTSGTTTTRPTPVPGSDDIQLLAGALGRTLTTTEQAAITSAAQTRNTAISAAEQTFETTVAALFGLSATDLQAKIQTYRAAHPGVRDRVTILQGALGITLTDAQKAAITTAMQTRATATQMAVTTYKATVAAALGLTVAALEAKVQAYQQTQSNSGGGPRGGPGGGPGGPPPGGGGPGGPPPGN